MTEVTTRPDAETTDVPPPREGGLSSTIGWIAGALEHQLSPGDVAELRRAGPQAPFSPALWKILVSIEDEDGIVRRGEERDEYERRWSSLLAGMALTVGMHDPRVPLGQALAEAGYSELRLTRLLESDGEALHHHIRQMARYLASKAQHARWTDVAHLVLTRDPERAEAIRRRIARAYYRAMFRQSESDE